jgi:hypothetical protein
MLFFAGRANDWRNWILVVVIYLLPWFGLGLMGRAGNPSLIISAVVACVCIFWISRKALDSPSSNLYNQQN